MVPARLLAAIGYSTSAPWRRVLSGSRWLLFDRLVRLGLGFLVGIVLARALGPARFGLFTYATTLAALFQPLVSLGMERILVRDMVQNPGDKAWILGTSAALRLFGGLIGCSLAVWACTWITWQSNESPWIIPVIASGNLFLAADVVDWAFQAEGRFRGPVLIRIAAFLVANLARIYFAITGASLMLIGATVAGEFALAGILLVFSASWLHASSVGSWRWRGSGALIFLTDAWPLLLAEIAAWIFQRVDLVILHRYVPDVELGCFATATKVLQAFGFIPGIAAQVLAPEVARLSRNEEALELTGKAMGLLFTLAFSLTFVLCPFLPWLVPRVFGTSYSSAVPQMLVLLWTNLFIFIGPFHIIYLVNANQPRVPLYLTWGTAFASLALNLLLIPKWHGMGAAVADLLAYGVTTTFGVALYAGSRPLLRENLRAIAAPLYYLRIIFSRS